MSGEEGAEQLRDYLSVPGRMRPPPNTPEEQARFEEEAKAGTALDPGRKYAATYKCREFHDALTICHNSSWLGDLTCRAEREAFWQCYRAERGFVEPQLTWGTVARALKTEKVEQVEEAAYDSAAWVKKHTTGASGPTVDDTTPQSSEKPSVDSPAASINTQAGSRSGGEDGERRSGDRQRRGPKLVFPQHGCSPPPRPQAQSQSQAQTQSREEDEVQTRSQP